LQKKIDYVPTPEDKKQLINATREVVADQAGLDIITDGMLTWDDYLATPASKFSGIKMSGLIRFYDNNQYYRRPIIEAEIVNEKANLVDNLELLKELNPGAKTKVVIPGPYTLTDLSENKYYSDDSELISAFSEALQTEVEAIDADYVQIDEPSLTYNLDKDLFDLVRTELKNITNKANGKTIISSYFWKLNSDFLSLNDIADYLGVDVVSFKDNYEKIIQSGVKNVQLGVLDARNTKIEDEIAVKNSIDMIDSEDMLISTNCGLEFLSREYALRKIDLLSKLANEE
jgi:5-methyltetrahydropteroyltriglutamate--homocysteine methyltransferase